jgi:hypothetical protein
MKLLGIFFIFISLIGIGIGFFNRAPQENSLEKLEENLYNNQVSENNKIGAYPGSDYRIYEEKLRNDWNETRDHRLLIMGIGFGSGGLLLVVGLICYVAGTEKKKQSA